MISFLTISPFKFLASTSIKIKSKSLLIFLLKKFSKDIVLTFLPFTSKKIKGILQSDNHEMKWSWDNLKNKDFLISEKLKINEPELLFSRIEDSEIQKQIDKLNKNN